MKSTFYALFFFVLLLDSIAQAQTTWTGTTNTDWATPTNWTAGVPDATDNVTIPNTANKPVIGAGTAAVAKSVLINASGMLTINATGSLSINGATVHGMDNYGTLDNSGTIRVGNTTSIGAIGMVQRNGGTLNNKTGGLIQIDRTGGAQAFYSNGLVNNEATIKIGSNAAISGEGIRIEGNVFNNKPGGTIQIDQTGSTGIRLRSGTVNNEAFIEMGSQSNVKGYGILTGSGSTFNNKTGGDIRINRIGILGATSIGVIRNEGTFTNDATITTGNIGHVYAQDGILNSSGGNFTNGPTGIISIEKTWGNGIWNSSGSFQNSGKVTIRNVVYSDVTGDYYSTGILSYAPFTNHSGAEIHLDFVGGGIISINTFTNAGIIRMGENAPLSAMGILNLQATGVFNNNTGGDISIKQTATDGVQNDALSTFNNNACAKLTVFDNVNNAGTMTNGGLLTVNTLQAHTNTGTLTNDGIIEYPQGNPIPNVSNNDLIVLPICGPTATPAVQIGASNSFTIGTTWYTTEALTTPAGTYTAGNNTFVANSFPFSTTRTYYFSIAGPSNTCPRTVSVKVSSRPDPTAQIISSSGLICERTTLQLSSSGGSQYSWGGPNFSSTLQNPTRTNATTAMEGTYSVSVIEWACTTSATTSVAVNALNKVPTITSVRVNGLLPNARNIVTVPAGQPINFSVTAINAIYYSWRSSTGFSSTLQNPSIANASIANQGQYVVVARNGCQFFGARTVVVQIGSSPTRIASAEDAEGIEMEINAYPNPVSKTLTVEVRLKEAQPLQLKLLNSIGQSNGSWQLSEPSTTHRTELDLSHLTGGIYLLEAQAGQQRAVKRVVKIQYE
jgi:hypothetical protein